MSDKAKGFTVGKMLLRGRQPYPVVIDDFDGDIEEFHNGMRLAGYSAR